MLACSHILRNFCDLVIIFFSTVKTLTLSTELLFFHTLLAFPTIHEHRSARDTKLYPMNRPRQPPISANKARGVQAKKDRVTSNSSLIVRIILERSAPCGISFCKVLFPENVQKQLSQCFIAISVTNFTFPFIVEHGRGHILNLWDFTSESL